MANFIPDYPTITYSEAVEVAQRILALGDSITVINPQMFDLTSSTPVSENPELFDLSIPVSAYHKSTHGYHSIAFARKRGLRPFERSAVKIMYNELALSRRISRRRASSLNHSSCLRFDPTMYQADGHLMCYSTGLCRKLREWESVIIKHIKTVTPTTSDRLLERVVGLLPSNISAQEWLNGLVNDGLLVKNDMFEMSS